MTAFTGQIVYHTSPAGASWIIHSFLMSHTHWLMRVHHFKSINSLLRVVLLFRVSTPLCWFREMLPLISLKQCLPIRITYTKKIHVMRKIYMYQPGFYSPVTQKTTNKKQLTIVIAINSIALS